MKSHWITHLTKRLCPSMQVFDANYGPNAGSNVAQPAATPARGAKGCATPRLRHVKAAPHEGRLPTEDDSLPGIG
jgi:hypothetical protein